jgi:hypothetical protein
MQEMLNAFREVWVYDFEYHQDANLRPVPICMVAKELKNGRELRLWQDQLHQYPFPSGSDVLFVSYNAVAEIRCHLVLGWPVPLHVLDLFTEFRNLTNGLPISAADQRFIEQAHRAKDNGKSNQTLKTRKRINSLLAALAYYDLPYMDVQEKTRLRDLILTAGPWTEQQRTDILEYCAEDVIALECLLPAMAPHISLGHALYRGRYMTAVARMEHAGVPIDLEMRARLEAHWQGIQNYLVTKIGDRYGVYDGRKFKVELFEQYLIGRDRAWPRHPSGALALDRDTFKDMARAHPELNDLHELRYTLGQLRLHALEVGADGRNRTSLFPFSSKTSRNQPSSAKFIFGPATWLRSLIRPPIGFSIAYIDYSQQEFAIAAALSGDEKMMEAYRSSDCYLAFAKQARAVPPDATRITHKTQREQFKACALAVQYGMGADSLAARIGQPPIRARELLDLHRRTYAKFWEWSDSMTAQALLTNRIQTCFGWTLHVDCNPNTRSLQNFPMQSHGAEMMRLAACLGTERGIEIVAPVHDAFLIMAPTAMIDAHVAKMQACMAEASTVVLAGFEVRADVQIVHYPNRYQDPRGAGLWKVVQDALTVSERETPVGPV